METSGLCLGVPHLTSVPASARRLMSAEAGPGLKVVFIIPKNFGVYVPVT